MLEYSARCLTSYAAEMQADWRGSGHQVPLAPEQRWACVARATS